MNSYIITQKKSNLLIRFIGSKIMMIIYIILIVVGLISLGPKNGSKLDNIYLDIYHTVSDFTF